MQGEGNGVVVVAYAPAACLRAPHSCLLVHIRRDSIHCAANAVRPTYSPSAPPSHDLPGPIDHQVGDCCSELCVGQGTQVRHPLGQGSQRLPGWPWQACCAALQCWQAAACTPPCRRVGCVAVGLRAQGNASALRIPMLLRLQYQPLCPALPLPPWRRAVAARALTHIARLQPMPLVLLDGAR